MALEPTPEQLRALAEAAQVAGDDPWGHGVSNDVWPVVAKQLWPLVRGMVLEAAAKACEAPVAGGLASQESYVEPWVGRMMAARVRALKGES